MSCFPTSLQLRLNLSYIKSNCKSELVRQLNQNGGKTNQEFESLAAVPVLTVAVGCGCCQLQKKTPHNPQ